MLSEQEIKRAAEFLVDPDAEDCERFASRYGETLLDIARSLPALINALKLAEHALITTENLRATDLTEAQINDFLRAGKSRSDLEFVIEHSRELEAIQGALAAYRVEA